MRGGSTVSIQDLGQVPAKCLLGFDDLTVLVETAVGAHAVGQLHFAALGAHAARGRVDNIVAAATGMGASTTHFALRYCHDRFSFYAADHRRPVLLRKRTNRYINKPVYRLQEVNIQCPRTAALSASVPYVKVRRASVLCLPGLQAWAGCRLGRDKISALRKRRSRRTGGCGEAAEPRRGDAARLPDIPERWRCSPRGYRSSGKSTQAPPLGCR